MLIRSLNESTRLVNRIHLRNEAKTATLEKLVPHLETLEEVHAELWQKEEEAKSRERKLRDQIGELQDASFEFRGTIGAQAAKIESLTTWMKKLEEANAQLVKDKAKAEKDFEEHKVKSKAQFDVFADRVKKAESVHDDIANAAAPILNAVYQNRLGSSSEDATEIFDKLRTTPEKYFSNIKEAASMGASQALAMIKSLYPRVDISVVGDGFADGTSDEQALELINEAQESIEKIAADVLDNFRK